MAVTFYKGLQSNLTSFKVELKPPQDPKANAIYVWVWLGNLYTIGAQPVVLQWMHNYTSPTRHCMAGNYK